MDKWTKISLLTKVQAMAVPLFILLGVWTGYALWGDPYRLHARPISVRPHFATGIEYKTNRPLEEYLPVVKSREMFKPSIIYETKKSEVTNVLGDLAFLGVVHDGANVQALLQNKKSGQSSFYSKGQTLDDLVIQEVRDDKVIFKHGDEALELIR